MPAEVIEVDFEARRMENASAEELLSEAMTASERVSTGFADLRKDLHQFITQRERELEWERSRRIELQKELLAVRKRNFPFSDEDVLRACRDLYTGRPVTANEIGVHLYGCKPTQSIRIRVGLALSRLAAAGHLRGERRRPEDPSSAHQWTPISDA